MFKNRHMTIAMLVAPVLAIISYFATDYFVSEPPQAAEAGGSYELLAKSNCRYQSGQCTLKNGDLELELRLETQQDGSQLLRARSSYPLGGARVALVSDPDTVSPQVLMPSDDSGEQWQLEVSAMESNAKELRIAMLADNTLFYASTETTFFQYDTVFPRDEW